jgi:mono/diheme cytochrome c family protein
LPKLANPLFRSRRFPRATTDGFFLLVEPSDSTFSTAEARQRLESLGAVEVEECREPTGGERIPRFVFASLAIAASLALIPPLWIAGARAKKSSAPRWHTFTNMDYQAKFKSQTELAMFAQGHQLFEDGRAMRQPVSGTVARGELEEDDRLYRGVEPTSDGGSGTGNGEEPDSAAADAKPSDKPDSSSDVEPNWVETIPISVTAELMDRGQRQYDIYCAVCHGRAGDGDGLVSERALDLEQGAWIQPTSIHAETVREQPVGKLFNTISNGVRKMPGYRDQMSAEDRWAIVLYMRALQKSRTASLEDVPREVIETLRETK